MNVQQPTDSPRIPLVTAPANRYESTNQDAKLVNCLVEKGQAENEFFVVARPGLGIYATLSGVGGGVYNWLGNIYSIFGTTFYKDGVSKGTVNGTNGVYTFSQTLGLVPKLFFHNGVKAYVYDDVGGLVEEAYTTDIVTTGNTHTTAIIDAIPSTAGINEHSGVTGSGIPEGSYVVSIDSGVQVTINVPTESTLTGTALTFSTSGYPASAVKGQAFLDGTTYVMTRAARIYGSDINDPVTWDALNFLTAQIEPDLGVFLAKQLVYVAAFKQWSTEIFYDAGNAVGSPLGPVQGAKVSHGCRSAGSVQDLEGSLIWISQTRAGSVGAMRMEGIKAQTISYPSVDRLLQHADTETVWSWSCKVDGHKLYGVTFKLSNLTLVYDLTSNLWSQWTDTNGNYFPFVASTYGPDQKVLLQHETDGKVYELDGTFTTDNGTAIPVDIYTPSWDGGTRKVKTLNALDFVGDQLEGQVMLVRCNDYDYDPAKWTNFRRVDMGRKRPRLTACGSFNRRAYHLRCVSPVRMRIKALEVDIDLGVT